MILQFMLQALMSWIMDTCLSCYNYIADTLFDVFSLNLDYFRQNVPVTDAILAILQATGWALLLGNFAFQALKGMMAGVGFEAEDPKILCGRTLVFAFLLAASPQICDIGMGLTGKVIELLRVPDIVDVQTVDESDFLFGASWLLAMIVNAIMIWQVIRMFLIIAERYVMLVFLVIAAPLAFGMGGSKQTEDIFKGWVRMFGSFCLMVILNLISLKLMLSAMSGAPSGPMIVLWVMLLIGLGRLARKLDEMVSRVGLNTARTGIGMGRGVPGMMAMAAFRVMSREVGSHMHKPGEKGGRNGQPRGANETRTNPASKSPTGNVADGVSESPATRPSRPPVGKSGAGKQTAFIYSNGNLTGSGSEAAPRNAANTPEGRGVPQEAAARPPLRKGTATEAPRPGGGQASTVSAQRPPLHTGGEGPRIQTPAATGAAPQRPPLNRAAPPSSQIRTEPGAAPVPSPASSTRPPLSNAAAAAQSNTAAFRSESASRSVSSNDSSIREGRASTSRPDPGTRNKAAGQAPLHGNPIAGAATDSPARPPAPYRDVPDAPGKTKPEISNEWRKGTAERHYGSISSLRAAAPRPSSAESPASKRIESKARSPHRPQSDSAQAVHTPPVHKRGRRP